jgi:hypothetical protein
VKEEFYQDVYFYKIIFKKTMPKTILKILQVISSSEIMSILQGIYKHRTELVKDIQQLEQFGHINNKNGAFVFNQCKHCSGPLLGHIAKENDCVKEEKFTRNMVMDI